MVAGEQGADMDRREDGLRIATGLYKFFRESGIGKDDSLEKLSFLLLFEYPWGFIAEILAEVQKLE